MTSTDAATPPHLSAAKLRRKVIGLAVAAAVGGFLFGFDSSVVNGAVEAVQHEYQLSPALIGFAVASALLGCALGAYIAGRLADRWGRIRVMLLGAALFFVSSIGSGAAFSIWDLVLWRIVGGLGIGIASVIAPTYISEIAPKAIRGALSSLQQLAITIGIFAALLSDTLIATGANGASAPYWFGVPAWRWMFIACAVPAVVYGILALMLPESPRYLATRGKIDQARTVLATVTPHHEVDEALDDIQRKINEDAENAQRSSLRGPALGLLPVVWVGILLSTFQQFVGINVIFYYSTSLWSAVGFDQSDSFVISVFTSIVNVAVTFIAIFLVDKVGRKPLLLVGSVGMAIPLLLMAIAFSQATISGKAVSLPGAWGPIALVSANAFVVFFGSTWGPLVWVLLGEIFPNRIRAAALGLAASAQWIANFVITVTFPILSQDVSLTVAYAIYAGFAALSFVFVFFFVPETKGRSLEEMDTLHIRTVMKSARK
ncbi:sugar porter family MFS transporter [Rathayibacter toxicus]|uniref:MFS transporter n=1 Tax=Rathayibacter toxicus TaxID=145458 RepID=A0A0C5BSC7_9MICO|nr:sugar porter family MFS transporter [Rathayibacter toxicus]AJM77567.1 major facilitator transporter [Rathayibacter toxicus]ALS56505.1 MFS transporter [Rathayibacter toxicus]KKM44607.1 major facilitator transporter [Rathayibacter toxicus]PPG21669.1 MFS transporter [Rathayibacter toxicus]PPG46631.1 MFS transporter [Rathayibacter toxicus]